jgi:hypothetical protein
MLITKENRIQILKELLTDLEDLKYNYREASPAWILIVAAQGHLQSIKHLEKDTTFDDETLGVKSE